MRRPLIAGNWKMNGLKREAPQLISKLLERTGELGSADVDVMVAPPFTILASLSLLTAGTGIKLGGQNMHFEGSGAFTGEVSPLMLREAGCEYVILGHSERRTLFGETDRTINKKVLAAIKEGLKPILCVGETLEEREEGHTIGRVTEQVKAGLRGLPDGKAPRVVIAYEPIWAIGTGKTATPDEAEDVHSAIRELTFELFEVNHAEGMRIIYGGSVKSTNIDSLMAQANIDGALVGGASLEAEDFGRIIRFEHP